MIVEAFVETPVNLTKRQEELLKEFAGESDGNHPETEGFFAKAKALWDDLRD
jgi:molecular chaperone DnaJ